MVMDTRRLRDASWLLMAHGYALEDPPPADDAAPGEEEPGALARGGFTQSECQRLRFLRWLYRRGWLTEFPASASSARVG
jgi:hypothetical protein